MIRIILVIAGVLATALPLRAQQSVAAGGPPNVFLDCQTWGCDSSHFRNEIRFVNWIRDRSDADVHALITSQSTGGGGTSFELTLIGQGRFAGDTAQIGFATGQTATDAERRDALTQRLAQGLLRFAVHTSAAPRIRLQVDEAPGVLDDDIDEEAIDDPWNFWVFSVSFDAALNGESRESEREFDFRASADRVTEDWKVSLDGEATYDEQRFQLRDSTLVSVRRDYEGYGQLVRSIADAWSAGVGVSAGTSTFANQDFYGRVAGVLEYSFLPYTDFSRRQLIARYSLGARYFDYEEETVYGYLTEQRADHQLELELNFRQPWGSASAEISGAHYLHDYRRYNLSTWGRIDVRLLRGLSLGVSANYSRVRDQIYIPAGDATDDEILLRRRALETGYRYRTSIGLRYTFGSIYNNVVNPRLSGW